MFPAPGAKVFGHGCRYEFCMYTSLAAAQEIGAGFPCLLFQIAGTEPAWVQSGMTDLKHFADKLKSGFLFFFRGLLEFVASLRCSSARASSECCCVLKEQLRQRRTNSLTAALRFERAHQ